MIAAALCALLPASAARAATVIVGFTSYFASGSAGAMHLTGSFTAELEGNRLTNITDVTLYRDGKAFRGSGSLFALQWDSKLRKWVAGGYLTLDGSANNVMFIDTNYAAGDAKFFNYFSSVTGIGNTAFLPSFHGYKTGSTSALNVWVEDAAQAVVPEPSAWALLVLGFGAIGGAIRRRGRRAAYMAMPAV